MKIVKLYDIGELVEIEPYSIFSNPIPIAWNTNPYGYGEAYVPGQTFIYEKSMTLYAQYTHVQVTYNVISAINGTYEIYQPSYFARFGSRIQIADFGIKNFKTWYDDAGKQLSIGQFVVLTSSVNIYMSADITYQLSYDANGGNGYMHSSIETQHLYFIGGNPIIEEACVDLPICMYEKTNYVCNSWKIGEHEYAAGQLYILSSDAIAYAQWYEPATYMLDCNINLVCHDLVFRYFMVKIFSSYNRRKKIVLSKLSFVDKHGNKFQYPHDVSGTSKNASPQSAYDGVVKALTTDAMINVQSFPCFLIFDLKTHCFDAAKYVNWQISTPSNYNVEYVPNVFELYFSNDGINWHIADACNYIPKPISHNEVIANGQLVVSESTSEI